MKTLALRTLAAGLLVAHGAAQAALIDRGNGLIYDTTRNVTWLADMNHALTSGYAPANQGGVGSNQVLANGRMGWDAAVLWADQLVYAGYNDWRLPTVDPTDTQCSTSLDPGNNLPVQRYGNNCTAGELSGLFITDLGNQADEPVTNQAGDTAEQISNLALFANVQTEFYWSGTSYAPDTQRAWLFDAGDSYMGTGFKENAFLALAVRDGDVARVPAPHTLALVLLALAALRRSRV